MNLLKPLPIKPGDAIGLFAPSWPAQVILKDKYKLSLQNLEKEGFKVVPGLLTKKDACEGYRSGSGKARAAEFMELIHNPEIKCLMAIIGGSNSSSMIEYLDFDAIRRARKIICGYSDVTSLHLAILHYSKLSTLYGPMVIPTCGEYPKAPEYTMASFFRATRINSQYPITIEPPKLFSNQFIDATQSNWQKIPRAWIKNQGWRVLSAGVSKAPVIVADLETLLVSAGTSYFPNLNGKILCLEEMEAPLSKEERNFQHLKLMGVFEKIKGLVISKPFFLDNEGADFSYDELILEIIGKRNYPIISNFDAGHTFPMISLGQMQEVEIVANESGETIFTLCDSFVEN